MALCAECFRAGNHEGHDYNMFKSRSGGACDCGYSIMNEDGYCKRHGRSANAKRSHEQIPESLICIPRRAMPRIIHRLAIQLRRQAVGLTNETDVYLDCLVRIADSSAVLRGLMIDALISEDVYSSQIRMLTNHPDEIVSQIAHGSRKILKREKKKLVSFKIPSDWKVPSKPISAFCDNNPIKNFLDELVFWIVVYEFHQKLVCFVLGFLMDEKYKEVFAKAFVNHYPHIVMCLTGATSEPRRHLRDSYEQLSRRILQISVQIYNDSKLTKKLCDEELTLHTLIYCLRIAIEGSPPDGIFSALKSNPLCPHSTHSPKVVCCDNLIIRERHLSSFTEDLNAILDFDHEAKRLVNDKDLLNIWLEMLSYFQTMSPYKRELNEHTLFETGPHVSVFTVEAEFCLAPLWAILSHFKDEFHISSTCALLEHIHTNLSSWFHKMCIGPNSQLDAYFMSFHIPLHRMFSATIRHIIYTQNKPDHYVYQLLADNQQVLGTKYSYKSAHGTRVTIKIEDFMKMLLLHPLQALTLYHQTRSSMWTRNGLMTINQAVTYVHYAYCYSTIDLDMFLLKYCATKIKPDTFLKSLMQRFYSWHCLSFISGPVFSDTPNDTLRVHYYFNIQPEQITQMVESCLVTLIQLLTLNIHCNISEREQTKQEMIALISVADRTYSYLVDMLPDRSVSELNKTDENFASLLDELTIYKPAQHGSGGNLQQGCYTLKPDIWENEYNPIHVLYRYYQRRDYQMSLERFFQQSKLTGKLYRHHHSSALWPPLRIPQSIGDFGPLDLSPLIECQSILGVIFSIIYKSLYVEEIPDAMMAYTIHLLELALRRCLDRSRKSLSKNQSEDHAKIREPEKNLSFTGKYCYRELIPFAQYYNNLPKEEAILKGRTIYSLFNEEANEPTARENPKLFPVVKHALDLAFDSTWFPFASVVDNCLVHVETVHSLPRDEFVAMLQCKTESRDGSAESSAGNSRETEDQQQVEFATSSSTRLAESQIGWSDLNDIVLEDVDYNEVDHEEDDIDEEEDVDGELDDDDVQLLERFAAGENLSSATRTSLIHQRESEDNFGSAMLRVEWTSRRSQFPISNYNNNNNNGSNSNNNQDGSDAARASTGNPNTDTEFCYHRRGFDNSQRLRPTRDRATNTSQDQVTPSATAVDNFAHQSSYAENFDPPQGSAHAASLNSAVGLFHQHQDSQQQIYAENLVTERRAILASEPRPMITGPTQPLALEASASSTSNSAAQTSHLQQPLDSATSSIGSNNAIVGTSSGLSSSEGAGSSSEQQQGRDHRQNQQLYQRGNQIERSLSEVDIQARFMGFFQSRLDSHARPASSRGLRPRQMARRANYRGAYLTEPYFVHNPVNQIATTATTASTATPDAMARSNMFVSAAEFQQRIERLQNPAATSSRVDRVAEGPPQSAQQQQPQTRLSARRSSACTMLNRFLSSRSTQQQQQDQRSRRLRKEYRQHHGESVLTLLLRLHAKYSRRSRSYHYNEQRAQENLDPKKRCGIGDGAHFITIVLDLICASDVHRMRPRLEHLLELLWPAPDRKEGLANDAADFVGEPGAGVKCDGIGIDIKTNSSPKPRASATAATASGVVAAEMKYHPTQSFGSAGKTTPLASASATTSSATSLTPDERRRLAKERQSKLMAEFANKQRAFMEKYAASKQQKASVGADKARVSCNEHLDEEPINLSSKLDSQETKPQMSDCDKKLSEGRQLTRSGDKSLTRAGSCDLSSNDNDPQQQRQTNVAAAPQYECCICGVEGPSDLANPLGQVVLLQSTSIYGHSHLRPRSERRLPCDELQHARLKEETYAKYLEGRIDLLCEHFTESSWLDSINIGAEGGVHVQSCGHYLHIECHQSYIRSLDQEDRLRARNDTDEFLCPVCRQLANSVLPILSGDARCPGNLAGPSSSLALVLSEKLDDQIVLIGSQLQQRTPPNQKELQSSAAFCSHLTKATAPQYRLVRSSASMHSLFLFLTSIARTNLETGLIVRSFHQRQASSSTDTTQGTTFNVSTSQAGAKSGASLIGHYASNSNKHTCFQLLFHVLALNAQTLINDQWFTCDQIWSHLTHHVDEKNRLSVKPANSVVPLLLRDPIAMLLQFLFAIANSTLCYRANFTCLVRILFNLTVIQSIALVLSYIEKVPPLASESLTQFSDSFSSTGSKLAQQRTAGNGHEQDNELPEARLKGKQGQVHQDDVEAESISSSSMGTNHFETLVSVVRVSLAQLLAPNTEEPLMNPVVRDCWPRLSGLKAEQDILADTRDGSQAGQQIEFIANKVKLACMPFLRAAAFLQDHLYGKEMPDLILANDEERLTDSQAINADFDTLIGCLELEPKQRPKDGLTRQQQLDNESKIFPVSSSLSRVLNWPASAGLNGERLVVSWSAELLRFAQEFSIAARTLLVCRPLAWYRPALMQLPHAFYDIFMFYYRKKCSLCQQVPKDIAVCLVCGAPICFRVSCCKDRSRSRQVHSQHCGANMAVFLAVHTSSIVVIRGSRACVWGSVYLDAHEEEDNGLQRGKPLYLVPARFALLEAQWLTHSFDHTCGKRWIYLQEGQ